MKYSKLMLVMSFVLLSGCANEPRLGEHVARLAQQQTFNPAATQENMGYIPTGTGEKMEGVYNTYSGKGKTLNSGTDSQFMGDFAK